MNSTELYQMKQMDETDRDNSLLADIRTVTTDTSLPPLARIEQYLQQVKNPYRYKVGDIVVTLVWTETGSTIQRRMEELLKMKC